MVKCISSISVVFFLLLLNGCGPESPEKSVPQSRSLNSEKIKGVSLEMPSQPINQEPLGTVKRVNSEWVALIPYAVTRKGEARVRVDSTGVWWGEGVEGTIECIRMSQQQGLKTMLKPHVWVVGQGWPGDFDLAEESQWLEWEKSYRSYILTFAHVADSMNVDLFCIGTEYRQAVKKRSEFWKALIKEVKTIYSGPVTYAANWDNYHNVSFWSDLDYIGIDAYFPLSTKARPTKVELIEAWNPLIDKLKAYSDQFKRPILFTEFGYKSIEYTNSGFWKYKEDTVKTSPQAQSVAYQALFESVWQQDWMAGGFFWKWHLFDQKRIGGEKNRRYTPQGKRVEAVIRRWYGY